MTQCWKQLRRQPRLLGPSEYWCHVAGGTFSAGSLYARAESDAKEAAISPANPVEKTTVSATVLSTSHAEVGTCEAFDPLLVVERVQH